ncbi:MAG: hypothetical protein OXG57_08650 [Acidimicrobiaceae bacterium]|nr:hypothetical protein [Acidimicrobiaceae bacterium]
MDLSFADDTRQIGDCPRSPSDSNVWVLTFRAGSTRQDFASHRIGQLDQLGLRNIAFIEHSVEERVCERLLVHGELRSVERVLDDFVSLFVQIPEWPHFNRRDFERIKDSHRNGIGPLIREVSPDPRSQLLSRLTDVDRFSVIVAEQVYAEFAVTRGSPIRSEQTEDTVDAVVELRDVKRLVWHQANTLASQ